MYVMLNTYFNIMERYVSEVGEEKECKSKKL